MKRLLTFNVSSHFCLAHLLIVASCNLSRVDPHQLRNLLHTLTDTELNFMHSQVALLLVLLK